MNKLVFATNNKHKLSEVSSVSNSHFQIVSLAEIGCTDDIPETAETLEGNALIKARWIHEKYGFDCFADDTGLEVEALDGRPGVYSARYAGEDGNAERNIEKLFSELAGSVNRKAQFRTVITLIMNDEIHYFEGIVRGEIITEKRGSEGFGYDPVFVPEGFSQTFAEMGAEIKNKISHRALAVNKLISFLNSGVNY